VVARIEEGELPPAAASTKANYDAHGRFAPVDPRLRWVGPDPLPIPERPDGLRHELPDAGDPGVRVALAPPDDHEREAA
jgi:hypothetical protein